MENGGGGFKRKISADDVISRLKDDGDFDRLRLKIIRRVKENEELRNTIVAMVRQSAALTRPGVEHMKPRLLSDAIHQEIGSKVLDQVSNSVWEIIKSGDGMKSEITETVQSVYNKLSKPEGNENDDSFHKNPVPVQEQVDTNGSFGPQTGEVNDLSDGDLKEPPGFSESGLHQSGNLEEKQTDEVQSPKLHHFSSLEEENKECVLKEVIGPNALDYIVLPNDATEQQHPCDGSDEDPDVPPGFGW